MCVVASLLVFFVMLYPRLSVNLPDIHGVVKHRLRLDSEEEEEQEQQDEHDDVKIEKNPLLLNISEAVESSDNNYLENENEPARGGGVFGADEYDLVSTGVLGEHILGSRLSRASNGDTTTTTLSRRLVKEKEHAHASVAAPL